MVIQAFFHTGSTRAVPSHTDFAVSVGRTKWFEISVVKIPAGRATHRVVLLLNRNLSERGGKR